MRSKAHHEIIGPEGPGRAAAEDADSRWAARAGIFGAYTLLLAWGAAYLVLFFLDRLPF